jgi:AAA+ ATPase superfamily predicted ATPase
MYGFGVIWPIFDLISNLSKFDYLTLTYYSFYIILEGEIVNPFKYGDPVRGEYYHPRPDLKKSVLTFIENQIHVVLIGPRRFGKTSFILDLLKTWKDQKRETVYIDVFNVTTHRDFLNQMVNAIADNSGWLDRVKKWFKELPNHFRPAIEWEPSEQGLSSIKLSLQAHKLDDDQVKQLISGTFDLLPTLGKRVLIAFDEFQTIGQLEDAGWLEATIRSKMQLQKNISYIFSGSRHGIIHDMFNNPARPFYRSCQLIDFPRLGDDFSPWIVSRFQKAEISCSIDSANYLRNLVDDTPNYVQMACFNLVANEVTEVNRVEVDEVLKRITSQNSYPYQTILNSLTPVQQRVLRLAACERSEIFRKDLLEKYEIKTPAHVSQAIKSLIAKQILDENTSKGSVLFDDPLFAIWLRNEFSRNQPA